MQNSDNNKSISVNIAVLTVSDTRTINNDKSGDYLVKSVKQEGHNCTERNIVTDNVGIILNILRKWINNKNIDAIIDDTEENFSSKIKKFKLLGVPYQIMIGKKSENDLIEFKEIGSDSRYLKIDKIIELISNKKK